MLNSFPTPVQCLDWILEHAPHTEKEPTLRLALGQLALELLLRHGEVIRVGVRLTER